MKNYEKKQFAVRKGFTLVEMSVAIIILGMIIATVFTVINRAIETICDWQTKMEAFDISRENMEKLLAQKSLSDTFEYGTSETNPDITWETTVESFYEPVSNKMWMRAVCTSEFKDSSGEEQKIELTHWLTSLSKKQIMQILEQQKREEQYAQTVSEDSSQEDQTQEEETQSQNDTAADTDTSTDSDMDQASIEELFNQLQNSATE